MTRQFLYSIAGRFVKVDKIGLVREGDRSNFHYRGDISGSEIKGKLAGIDYSITDEQGFINVNILEVLTTDDDGKVFLQRTGRSQPPGGDVNLILIKGEGRAATASPKLAWLNDAPITWEARLRRDSLDFEAEVYR